jgi:hypothetical protein
MTSPSPHYFADRAASALTDFQLSPLAAAAAALNNKSASVPSVIQSAPRVFVQSVQVANVGKQSSLMGTIQVR